MTDANRARARDPNTPPEELFRLAIRYPDAVLENPVLPLLTLEDPGVLQRVSSSGLVALMRRPEFPLDWVWLLAEDPRRHVRFSLVSCPVTPRPLLLQLIDESPSWVIQQNASRNPNTPAWLLARLTSNRNNHGPLSENPRPPASLRDGLAAVAWGDATGVEKTGAAGRSGRAADRISLVPPTALAALAGCRGLAPARARKLARHKDVLVRVALAKNPTAPARVLEDLALDPDKRVRASAAGNPSLPGRALDRLRRDEDTTVQRALNARRDP